MTLRPHAAAFAGYGEPCKRCRVLVRNPVIKAELKTVHINIEADPQHLEFNVSIAMSFAPSPIHHRFYGWDSNHQKWVVYDTAIPTLHGYTDGIFSYFFHVSVFRCWSESLKDTDVLATCHWPFAKTFATSGSATTFETF